MEKVGTGLGLLAVVGLLVGGALIVPDDAAGATRPPDLPSPAAQEPRVAFSLDRDEVAQVDLDFSLDVNGSAGYVLDGVELTDLQVGETGRAHEGETSSVVPDGGSDEYQQAYALVSARGANEDVDVYVRLLPAGAPEDLPEDQWETVRVTCDDAQESHPVLTADLTQVAYSTDVSGDWEVVVAPVGERCAGDDAVSPAPDPDADDLWPAWGPDDASVFFSSTRDDPLGDIYAVRLETGGATTASAAVASPPIVTTAYTASASAAVVVPDGPVERLTDDPGADTMPTVLMDAQQEPLVLFTTTRFRAEGSVATFELGYYWSEGDSAGTVTVHDPWSDAPDGAGPDVGSEPTARLVDLDDGGSGILVAYTVPDEESAEPAVWVAYLRVRFGEPSASVAWAIPSVAGVSHPDWATVRAMQGGFYSDEETEPGSARLRFTQRSGARDVADGATAGGAGPTDVRVLTDRPATEDHLDDSAPAYSPDGTRVAFSALLPSDYPQDSEAQIRDIAVVEPSTGAVSTLVPMDLYGLHNPDWSPDGARVAYSGLSGSQERIGVGWVDVGTGATDWTPDDGGGPWTPLHPSWAPDGERLVAEAGSVDDDDRTPYLGVLDVDARTWTPLTMEVVDDCYRPYEEYSCPTAEAWVRGRDPAWSPDGSQIAVAGLRLVSPESEDELGPEPFALDVAPGGISVIDVAPGVATGTAPADGTPAVVGVQAATGFDRSAQIRTTQPDVVPTPDPDDPTEEPTPDPDPEQVATPSRARIAWSDGPAWSPDGAEIVFSGQPAGRPDDRDLYAVAPDGTGLRVVVDSAGPLTDPDVQPVGDLALDLTADPARLDVDGTSAVAATVANEGTIPAAPTVVLALPAGLRAGDLPSGCTAESGTTPGTSLVTCPATQPLAPGDELTTVVPVVAEVSGSFDVAGAVTNPGAEDDVDDNVDETSLQVDGPVPPPPPPPPVPVPVPGGEAALEIDIGVSAERAWVGGHGVDVTVTLRNTGDATATDLVLASTYPPGLAPSGIPEPPSGTAPSDAAASGGESPDDPVSDGPTTDGPGADGLATEGPAATDDCLGGWGTCPLDDLPPGGELVVSSTLEPVGPAGTGTVDASVTGRTVPVVTLGGLLGDAATGGPLEPDEPLTGEAAVDVEVVQPWLRILPDVASPGDVVLAYGEDFPPGEDAMLTWSDGITSAPGPYPVNEDGRLSVPVLVVRNDLRGNRWLRVTSGPPPAMTTPRVVDASTSDLEADPDAEPVPPCPEPPAAPPDPDATDVTDPTDLTDLTDQTAAADAGSADLAWCEVDGATLVVTPTVSVPETLERR
ncbi:PD40 domain-containing protein [Cellulosimicrobium arenosum]|uniref:PD40 domain-containing protein n=1 Tax=Cellulosimicrobium arenosum TaxID=2708133 RepID=A0A927J0J9_9MICO|nr:PD40 domain-containing protein [Cellulosimicrobium arenosum]MBD8079674.1 PD40 domain-containing protein [Cellulosimicrobium arenosum]